MAHFEPFAGFRYDPGLPLELVIAPPYDVVDEAERADLAARSPYNAIHVELPVPDGDLDRYAHADKTLRSWITDRALVHDDVPSFYVYKMSFTDEKGSTRSTTGVVGALRIDVEGGDQILPHEQTMPKPKGDRLDLLRATKTNISPIWGLSLGEGLTTCLLGALSSRPPDAFAHDDEDVLHELWVLPEGRNTEAITSIVASAPIVVADGHHRYETSRHYQREQRDANGNLPGPYDLVMALVVELVNDELSVRAIHRLVSGVASGEELLTSLSEFFTIAPAERDPVGLLAQMEVDGGLGLVTKDSTHLLVPKANLEEQAERPLDSSRLDVVLAKLAPSELVYQHGASNVIEAVENGSFEVAFLLRPATVEQIADTAHSGRRMPPKTTFFHPKPRTGIVYRRLGDEATTSN